MSMFSPSGRMQKCMYCCCPIYTVSLVDIDVAFDNVLMLSIPFLSPIEKNTLPCLTLILFPMLTSELACCMFNSNQ